MLHVQVVTGLAPPKGINLPFVSSGGTSLVVSALAVGLALGAARPTRASASELEGSAAD
jgi:cell division protein FtsW